MTILLFFLSLKLLPSRTPTIQVRIPIQVFRLFLANKTGQEQNEKRLFGWFYNVLGRFNNDWKWPQIGSIDKLQT